MKQHVIELEAIWRPETQQAVYRALLQAVSYPGAVHDLTTTLQGSPASLGVLATLLDAATSFCDVDGLLREADAGLLECSPASAATASYLLCDAASAPKDSLRPRLGSIYRPELGATLLLQGAAVGEGEAKWEVRGPGVADVRVLALDGFHADWFRQRDAWIEDFPMGVDLLLCDGVKVAALPRTARLKASTT